MKHAGRTFFPGLAAPGAGGLVLFVSSATWLQMTCAMVTLIGVALLVFAIGTPGFLERDLEQREDG